MHKQENAIKFLENSYERVKNDFRDVNQAKIQLENELEFVNSKLTALKLENDALNLELNSDAKTRQSLEKQKQEVLDMAACNDTLSKVNKSLTRGFKEYKERSAAELKEFRKQSKLEIKAWRKDLGEERREKIKLENKLEEMIQKNKVADKLENNNKFTKATSSPTLSMSSLPSPETFCTICAEQISNYNPKYFNGIEINPACKNCQDSSISEESSSEVNEETPTGNTMETPKKEPETLPAPNAEVLEDVSQDDIISTAGKNHHMEGILRRKIRLKVKTKLEIRARNERKGE